MTVCLFILASTARSSCDISTLLTCSALKLTLHVASNATPTELSPTLHSSSIATGLDNIHIPKNRSMNYLGSTADTGQRIVIDTSQRPRLSFHEGAVFDLEAVARYAGCFASKTQLTRAWASYGNG